ncbi:uncharacterized protein N7482_005877 [Penicillium canariense]|uniref:Uncharacterized protein n=1 Tax=Penicillium canariense TaxID=189055 RepID=A0A9W9LNF4_9EURO|nr:uncharacterized protein N7482_005877 [Penicillium canariense]KAJ5167096.1 hypothetical protein N7482_005877 [Penicillium canariense]
MHPTLTTLFLLSTPIHAGITARVWAHFYPNCPGEPFTNLDTYENYEETTASQVITAGMCADIGVPSYEHNLVSAISVDAELLPQQPALSFPESGPSCNITVHQVPECIDPPLITNELRNGVEVSQCASRSFAAYSQVWLLLVCNPQVEESLEEQAQDIPRIEETAKVGSAANAQTPGSNAFSWSKAQTDQSERKPEEEDRVNNDGHAESDKIVHDIMEKLKNMAPSMVTGKHNETQPALNATLLHNGTASGNQTLSRRKLSVLRNRVARLY